MKYRTRNEYINTVSGGKNREDSWLTELENQLHKQAVQPRRVDQSMFEQINNIIGGSKSKYSTVEDAVMDMQRRSGYLDYLNKKVAGEDSKPKQNKPKLLVEHPEIEVTINNYCSHTRGEQDLPAVIEKIKSIHSRDVKDGSLWDEKDLAEHIHHVNEGHKQHRSSDHSANLGTIDRTDQHVDPANYDAWHGLMPAKV